MEEAVKQAIVERYFGKVDAFYLSSVKIEDLMSVFSENVTWTFGDKVFNGCEALRKVFLDRKKQFLNRKHELRNIVAIVEGDKASATCELTVTTKHIDGRINSVPGYNAFRLRKQNGIWKITDVQITLQGGDLATL